MALELIFFFQKLGPKKNGLIKQFLKDVNWSEVNNALLLLIYEDN